MFCCYECKYANKYLASPLGSSPTSEMLLMIVQTVQSHCEDAWGTGLQVGTLNQKYRHQTTGYKLGHSTRNIDNQTPGSKVGH